MDLKCGWTEAKKEEPLLNMGWHNHEKDKPLEKLLNEPNMTIDKFFTEAPEKW